MVAAARGLALRVGAFSLDGGALACRDIAHGGRRSVRVPGNEMG
jgi:hypothetical protein